MLPASTSTLGLDLVVQPTSVFAGSSAELTIVIGVPIGGQPVAIANTDSIVVSFPVQGGKAAPLVTTLTGITVTPPSALWTYTGPQAGRFLLFPVNGLTLQPGDSVSYVFDSLPIVSAVSSPVVPIDVSIGAGEGSTSLAVGVQAAVPGIIAWADPAVVALNTAAKLRWATIGGTIVRVTGFLDGSSGSQDQSVGPPNFMAVNPTADGPSFSGPPVSPSFHTYTVELFSEPGDQLQGAPQSVSVYLHGAVIVRFGFELDDHTVVPAVTVPYGQTVTLAWSCVFVDPTQGVSLAFNQTSFPAPAVFKVPIDPSKGLPLNGNQVQFALTAPGYYNPGSAAVTLTFKPIVILYFKFANWKVQNGVDVLSGLTWATDPADAQGTSTGPVSNAVDLWFLTVVGPGGPFTRYLGLGSEPYVEIRYFSPTSPVKSGQPFTLQWFTNAATTLTLTTPAGLVTIDPKDIAKGTSQPFTLTAPFTFVLSAQAGGQPAMLSYLAVTPS